MYRQINAVFNVRGRGVIFAWGDTIYNPMGISVTPALLAHESVHGARQGSNVEGWWSRYLEDPEFRYAEELPAHRAEYQKFCEIHPDSAARRRELSAISARLSGPLYGSLVTAEAARNAIV